MNKRIIGLLLAGFICICGEVTESYANESLNEKAPVKIEQVRTQNGWVKDEYGSWYYYKNGEMLKEKWLKDNGKWYYFDDYGCMAYGRSYFINGKYYIFDNSGAMIEKKGWIYLKNEEYDYGVWYYGNGDGTVKTEQWLKDNGKWYYVDYDGWLITNGSYEIGNKTYLFDANGAMIEKKGWICLKYEQYDGTYSSVWYYGNGDGTVKTNQWIEYNRKWYYVDYWGGLITNGSYKIGNKVYVFDSNGAMIEKKGWICFKYEEYDGTYYLDWYYGNGDGTVKTNQWIEYNGKWYYVVGDGWMINDGSLDIDGKEYVFDSNGVCINPY